ncbi:CRISPR-associated helicase Cas3' (plasmid) [Methylobacterium currus]|uniref:CRISPR-associated helicase Cas3' n=1 Tax=Methylobacterium currus TaxID=2051553 RepID=UPI001E33869B|nr:CRISPR-associated helicase Cas3' [Methylobacterium currus]UHC20439.1 CRISPR-associated helicase Cas3' [Methylobacterium currus]
MFRNFWGKARPRKSSIGPRFHPAWAHGLDVAASGLALLRARPTIFSAITQPLGWSFAELEALWLHLLALHDIGKFSPLFQIKAPEHYPHAAIPWPDELVRKNLDPGHPTAGYVLLRGWLAGEKAPVGVPPVCIGWSWGETSCLLDPILGHHGRPVAGPDGRQNWGHLFRPAGAAQAAFDYWQAVEALLPVPDLPPPTRTRLLAAGWSLAGLTALADWIGSDQEHFPYVSPETDFKAYWEAAKSQAEAAVAAFGLVPAPPAPLMSFVTLTGVVQPPTEVQSWAAEVVLPNGPLLIIIEDVTGGGKTEAALMLAHRLLAEGRARGLFFALPTMATANAMFSRVQQIAPRLFADTARPSLTLAHGAASLHPAFRPVPVPATPDASLTKELEGEEDSAAEATEWLMGESRRALLADLGVGTVDQALLAVLPARYQAVRLAGLADKVLLVDEAHSYDAYVGTELERLVAFHAAGGGSTIILSATLPQATKNRVVAAWRGVIGGCGAPLMQADYPLATLVAAAGNPLEQVCAARPDLRRALTVTRLPNEAAALNRIYAAAARGACVAYVRNTVDDAIEAVAALRREGLAADLFHARFAMHDRLAIERRVLTTFGKNSRPEGRRGRVLVATQVLEQSLDLDFDLLVSDLAPVDSLLQRAGRLWRHDGRERQVPGPELIIVSPDPSGSIGADWVQAAFPRAAAVYADPTILWRTARTLFTTPTFEVPQQVRATIEAVYAADETDVPQALLRAANKARGKASAERAFADQNLLVHRDGYRASGQAWEHEHSVVTRLAEEARVLRLARREENRLVPWAPDPDPRVAWSLSEVKAYERVLRGRHQPEDRWRPLVEAARAGWSRYDDDVILLPLEEQSGGMWSGVLEGSGKSLTVTYSVDEGLRVG